VAYYLSSSSFEQTNRCQACGRSPGQDVFRLSVSRRFTESFTKDHNVPLL